MTTGVSNSGRKCIALHTILANAQVVGAHKRTRKAGFLMSLLVC